MKPQDRSKLSQPRRSTLVDQTIECLRTSIVEERWQGAFPSEAELCRELGISRGTLRKALQTLFQDGLLIPGGRGGRHQISSQTKQKPRARQSPTNDLVRILSPQPRFIVAGKTQLVFQVASEVIGRAGLHLEFEHHPGLWKLKRPGTLLRKITQQPNTGGWVLYRSTEAVQRWFAESGIPAVVIGGKYPDIPLSHAEFDLVAASRHAAGVFASRQCTSVVFLNVHTATAGDKACEAAFHKMATSLGMEARTVAYDDTVPGLCRVLDSLLGSHSLPDGFLVGFPNHVPATIGHLNRRKHPVPESALVISRLDAQLLVESIPSVAYYRMDAEALGRGLGKLINQTVKQNNKALPKSHVVMPEFVDGSTAGTPDPF